jgi:transketolase
MQTHPRWQAFGWHVVVIDGHEMIEIPGLRRSPRPNVRSGFSRARHGGRTRLTEDKPGWHGKRRFEGADAAGFLELQAQVLTETGP